MLVNFYQTTRRYNSGDSHLDTRSRENLKSYKLYPVYVVMICDLLCDILSNMWKKFLNVICFRLNAFMLSAAKE
jgi:hypothetical protein